MIIKTKNNLLVPIELRYLSFILVLLMKINFLFFSFYKVKINLLGSYRIRINIVSLKFLNNKSI